jgi:hypothetical protein
MDKLSESIWEIISQLRSDNIDYYKYYETKINIDYSDIINIWEEFIKIEDLQIKEKNIVLNNSGLKIGLLDNDFSLILETILISHVFSYTDDILLFYIKDSDKILLLVKSYKPLINSSKIQLPYWSYLFECKEFIPKFNDMFNDKENIFIVGYNKLASLKKI